MQEPHTLHGQRWVFRAYLCPWHLSASNKWRKKMGPNFKRLVPIEYTPDAVLLSQNETSAATGSERNDHE